MKANFIKYLAEAEIKTTEMALCISSISEDIQSMVEKLTNIKTKDVSELVKKIKYDNNIEEAENLNQMIGEKLDQAIQTLSEIKSSIDNEVVNISQGKGFGDDVQSADDLGSSLDDSDMADDFGDDFEEFNADEMDSSEDLDTDLDNSAEDLGELDRQEK